MSLKIIIGLLFSLFLVQTAEGLELPPVHRLKLKNGMTFLLVPRGEVPIFTAYIRFKVGGMDEEQGKTGLAHLMEHMAFKGTETIPSEVALARLYEREGGQGLNATTSKDLTSYFVSFPSEKLSFWANLEADKIFHSIFRDFEKEKRVVMEERRTRVEDQPEERLYEEVIQKAFAGTPYEWLIIGHMKDLEGLSLEDLKQFYERHYLPEKGVGVLVGNFDLETAKGILQKSFGNLPRKKGAPSASFENHPLQEEVRVTLQQVAEPRLMIAYPKPCFPAEEDIVFALIGRILGGGESSRLYQELVIEKKIAAGFWYDTNSPGERAPNLFLVQITPLQGKEPETILREFDEVIRRFVETGPSQEELEKAKNQIQVGLLGELETNRGLAAQLSYHEILTGDWRSLEKTLERISQITVEEVQGVAARFLGPQKRVVGILKK